MKVTKLPTTQYFYHPDKFSPEFSSISIYLDIVYRLNLPVTPLHFLCTQHVQVPQEKCFAADSFP